MTFSPHDIENSARPEVVNSRSRRARQSTANGHDQEQSEVDLLDVERSTEIKTKSGAYMVKGIIEDGDFSVLFGPSGGGKTFAATDIAHGVATGRERLLGRRVKQARVLLCALEGARGLGKRIEAVNRELGPAPELFVYRRSLVLFDDAAMAQRLIATIRSLGARFVIIDTLARTMAGGSENAPEDMGRMISVFGRISEATGAHVMVVHHTGKDESRGGRGHSSLKAAADVEIEVTGEDSEHIMRLSKVKDGPDGERIAFRLRVVQLGVDEEGDDITTCVVEERGTQQASPRNARLSASDIEALTWLREAISEFGERPPFDLPAGISATVKPKWTEIGRKRSGKEADTVLKAVDRAITRLTVAKMIGVNSPYVWVLR